jgi:hypothetical protein
VDKELRPDEELQVPHTPPRSHKIVEELPDEEEEAIRVPQKSYFIDEKDVEESPPKDSLPPRKEHKRKSPTPKKFTKRIKYVTVDPEEESDNEENAPEETIDWAYYAKQSQIVPPGIRRSTRRKIPPLEFWRGEKVVYGVHNGTLGIVDVVKRPYTPPKKKKKNPRDKRV